jgi:hypothetical protein
MGCFLEFLYTGDYFPKKVPGQRTLEKDPSIPDVDMTGDQLLKHAKVYTLAEKFGLTLLKNLASSKIPCVNSTAKGEIAYARYVYQFTAKDDTAVRVPVANFWATRSHTLRAEAEDEFRGLCLEYPQFGYDVLSTSFTISFPLFSPADLALSQPASSTRSSSASATKRCTPVPPAARASGPVTAAAPPPKRADGRTKRDGDSRLWSRLGAPGPLVFPLGNTRCHGGSTPVVSGTLPAAILRMYNAIFFRACFFSPTFSSAFLSSGTGWVAALAASVNWVRLLVVCWKQPLDDALARGGIRTYLPPSALGTGTHKTGTVVAGRCRRGVSFSCDLGSSDGILVY